MHGRGVVHIVEPQDLFVPTLVEVFLDAGLRVNRVDEELDPLVLLEEQPDVLFVDTDYIDDPVRAIRIAHVLVPDAVIVVYSAAVGPSTRAALIAAGASRLVAKSAERDAIVDALRAVTRRGLN